MADRHVCTLHPPFTIEEMTSLANLLGAIWPGVYAVPDDATGAMLLYHPTPPPPGTPA